MGRKAGSIDLKPDCLQGHDAPLALNAKAQTDFRPKP